MKVFAGIDPGDSGAIALLPDGAAPAVFDFADPAGFFRLKTWALRKMAVHAVLEKISAMPKQGVASTFKFGTNYGRWQGRLEALGIPYDLVTPQAWQKQMFDAAPKQYKWVAATAAHARGVPQGAREVRQMEKQGKRVWTFKRKALDTKAMSLERARRLFPALADKLKLKKHDGRADALLMAEFCRRHCRAGVCMLTDPLAG